jgi:hypothetical protein
VLPKKKPLPVGINSAALDLYFKIVEAVSMKHSNWFLDT